MKYKSALAVSLFGVCLLASSFVFRETWGAVDRAVFYYFNSRLVPGGLFLKAVAYSNMRVFDVAAFGAMGALYFYYFCGKDNAGRRKMLCLGVLMLLAGICIKQAGGFIPISHGSPTLALDNANRLSKMTTIVTKDASRNSFPGDHGMMLMIFAGFMARYFGRRAFAVSVPIVVLFAMPRIASGAHWFSDVYMGSLAISCITLSWILLTPASDICAARLEKLLPSCFFPIEQTGMFGKKGGANR